MSDHLPENLQKLLYKANILTVEKVLFTSNQAFSILGATDSEIRLIRTAYAKQAFLTGFVPVSECEAHSSFHWEHISFGCTSIDRLLRNVGISVRGITEICGAAGAGKSQLCLQLALMVQLPSNLGGLDKGAVFICSEGAFPSKRLFQLINTFNGLYKQSVQNIQFSNKIYIEHVSDFRQLRNCVANRLPVLLRSNAVGLVVVDSVGAIFRPDSDLINRAGDMRELAHLLIGLSNQHGCAIVCVNQVSSLVDVSGDNRLKPALGLAWANLVSTRLKIHRTSNVYVARNNISDNVTQSLSGYSDNGGPTMRLAIRQMEVVFSPEVAPGYADFLISKDGLVDVPDE